MRLGVGRLLLAIASVVARMGGEHSVADMLAFAFFTIATFNLWRTTELSRTIELHRTTALRAAVQTVRS